MQACAHDDDGKCVEYLLTHKADPSIVDNKVSFIFFNLQLFSTLPPPWQKEF